MPYIAEGREEIDAVVKQLPDLDDGKFNYAITKICHQFILRKKLRYFTLVRVFGGLICVMLELYRRVAAGYEDKKIKENGHISDLDV